MPFQIISTLAFTSYARAALTVDRSFTEVKHLCCSLRRWEGEVRKAVYKQLAGRARRFYNFSVCCAPDDPVDEAMLRGIADRISL